MKQYRKRYYSDNKDIFIIWNLLQKCDTSKLKAVINKITLKSKIVPNYEKIIDNLSKIFSNKAFIKRIDKSKKNWTNKNTSFITKSLVNKLQSILN